MTRKENLLKEVYLLKNRIAAIKGDQPLDLETPMAKGRFYDDLRKSKAYEMESELQSLTRTYERLVEEKRCTEIREAYYATPEGAVRKAKLEAAIETKIEEWKAAERCTTVDIEQRIEQALGMHWGVKRYDKGFLCIGVIDPAESTPHRREFFFGQSIEIRYEERPYFEHGERFECNCGSCGNFSMQGGTEVGERALFYVGIGKLYGDMALVEWLRLTMRDSARTLDRLSEELDSLRAELKNPVVATGAQ